jgi:hypothetical protein
MKYEVRLLFALPLILVALSFAPGCGEADDSSPRNGHVAKIPADGDSDEQGHVVFETIEPRVQSADDLQYAEGTTPEDTTPTTTATPSASATATATPGASATATAAPNPDGQNPVFNLPPPDATALETIDRQVLLKPFDQAFHLSDVARRLNTALEANGYPEQRYFRVFYKNKSVLPDAFAMVTRVEQINSDGSPKGPDERYKQDVQPLRRFSFRELIRSLIGSDPGYYRVIVFIVAREEYSEARATVTRREAAGWLRAGLNELPEKIGEREYTDGHECTALIYQFKQPSGEKEVYWMEQGQPASAREHLEKAGIWDALARAEDL